MKIILYTHITAGVVSLISGLIAIFSKKGKNLHLKAGKIYFLGMTIVFISALILSSISFIPFLFMIAFLSYYGCFSGVRILKFRKSQQASIYDNVSGYLTLVMGVVYIFYAVSLFIQKDTTALKWISLVFGILTVRAALIGLVQFKLISFSKIKKQSWLEYHLYAMSTSYIAATTAFVVTMGGRLDFNHWILWLAPTIIGVPLINYWRKKYQ